MIHLLMCWTVFSFDRNTKKFLKARFIDQSDKYYTHDTLHIYAENAQALPINPSVLNNFPGEA